MKPHPNLVFQKEMLNYTSPSVKMRLRRLCGLDVAITTPDIPLNGKPGRPPVISLESEKALIEQLRESDTVVRTTTFTDLFNAAARKDAISRQKAESQVPPISKSTRGRYEAKLKIKTKNAEITTTARQNETSSVYNAVSFAAVNHLMSNLCSSHLILNSDATQFAVGAVGDGKVEVKYLDDMGTSKKKKVTPEKNMDETEILFTIKYYLLMSAFGFSADPVFVIADGTMNEDEIDVHEVIGLGVGTDINAKGYVVFCRTRAVT